MSEDTHDKDRYKAIGVEREHLMDAYVLAQQCGDTLSDDRHLRIIYVVCIHLSDIIIDLDDEARRLKETLGDSVPDLLTNAKGGRTIH